MQALPLEKKSAGKMQRRSSKEFFHKPGFSILSDLVLNVKRLGKVKPQYITSMSRSPS